MPTLHDLLAKGYFPRELPPPFSTASFASAVVTGNQIVPGFKAKKRPSTVLGIHNLVRGRGLRRDLGLPNPVSYSNLCEFVVRRWKDLQVAAGKSPFSLTKPVDTKAIRPITGEYDLSERAIRRIELRSRSRFVLRTDINRFYPSIYTHSLPWAIHTKEIAKTAKANGKSTSLWADELDKLTRNLNDGQTMGIPIGPDCSLILAEILLAAVDQQVALKIPGIRGIRFIDDYEFAVNLRSDAEEIVSVLQSVLSHYELALNSSKTRIIELPESIEPLWTSRLRTFFFREAGIIGQRNDLMAFFDLVFTQGREEADEGMFKYAIARLNSVKVVEDNWPIFEGLLGQCASVEPACLPQVCEQIVHYKSEGETTNESLWQDILNRIVCERLPLGHASEAVWAMWMMNIMKIRLTDAAASAVDSCEDSAAALMGLWLANNGLGDPALLGRLNLFAEPGELFGRQWLLCYEGIRQGWIKPPSGNGIQDAQFKFLYGQGVSFFDTGAAPPTPRRKGPPVTGGGGGGSPPD